MSRVAPLLLAAVLVGCTDGERDSRVNDSPTSTTGDPTIRLSGVLTCDDPEGRAERVFDREELGADWPKPAGYRTPQQDIGLGGRGIAVADLDGDGVDDLLVPGHLQPTRFLKGHGDRFEEVEGAFAPEAPTGLQGATLADIDADGDLDALLYSVEALPVILWNDGAARFTVDERSEWHDGATYACGGSASFGDYDGDGILDLFYGRLGFHDPTFSSFVVCDSYLFRGLGGGEFEDVSELLAPPIQEIRVLASGWHDFDDNGWLDLYTVADCAPAPQPNQLMLNDGGVLTHAPESGMHVRLAGMGLAVGDLNGDRLLDAVVPGIDEYAALLSEPSLGTWVDAANAIGLRTARQRGMRAGWGLELADLDNDGHLDLATAFGRDRATEDLEWLEPDAIHHNLGDGTFEEVGQAWGFADEYVERGLVVADLDDDGWLDVVKREIGGVVLVDRGRCDERAWLVVRLHDEGSANPFAVGAKVTVVADGQRHLRTVHAGSTSYASSGPPELHFGLGEADVVEAIEVVWPGGETTTWTGIEARQRVDLWRD